MTMNQQKKIVIVDDDDRNIFALNAVLKSKGYLCLSTTSPYEGLEILRQQNDIGVALIDMMMPGMDGYEMINAIRNDEKISDLPVIAVTAQAMAGDREKCLETGASDYVSKPINIDLLLNMLNQHLPNVNH